jgi:hypothetical protein
MRTTISVYHQLDKWIESSDAAYAAHPEPLAATSTPAFQVTSTSETPAHKLANANTHISTTNRTSTSAQ